MPGDVDVSQVVVQTLAAGPCPHGAPAGDVGLAASLHSSMIEVRSAPDAESLTIALLDLACGLVRGDAMTLELRGPAGLAVPWVLAHRGLRDDELVDPTAPGERGTQPGRVSQRVSQRLPHRLSIELTGDNAQPGELTVWRSARPFDSADEERARLAATSMERLLLQLLRRTKSRQRYTWSDLADGFTDALIAPDGEDAIQQIVVDQVRDVSGCDGAWLFTGPADRPVLRAVSADQVTLADLGLVDGRHTMSAGVMVSGEQLRVTHLASHLPASRTEAIAFLADLGPAVLQPVRIDGSWGVLGMAWTASRTASYLSLDPDMPRFFAARVAMAARVGQARTNAERLAVLEERHRIRMDLHDKVVQHLYVLGMALEGARLREGQTGVADLLDRAVERVDETIAEIRRTITGLGVVEEGTTLYDAMAEVLDQASIAATFRPELRVHGLSSTPVSPAVTTDLLAVLQEAVSNVVRHARASRCRISLELDEKVTLQIEDDGVGIAPGVSLSGLRNLRDRARAHGGDLVVAGLSPGTRLTWTIPDPASAPEAVADPAAPGPPGRVPTSPIPRAP